MSGKGDGGGGGGGGAAAAASTGGPPPVPQKIYRRSASWSVSWGSEHDASNRGYAAAAAHNGSGDGPLRLPRSHQNSKPRSCLPPLSIARRSLDEWPLAGSDDVGEWPQALTPNGTSSASKPGDGLKLDLSSLRAQRMRDRITCFDKECSKVADHIYVGGDAVARNRETLRQNGITHILNCVGNYCPEYFKSDLVYKTLWLKDSPTEDITSILYDVFDYFEDVREQGGRVFVHCCQGVSRSTSLVIAYLMWRKGQSFEDAFKLVKSARGIANPNVGFACQLMQCQKRVHADPLSPKSMVRMYRMAPHSEYDPLHLVPKMLSEPSPSALDSRGAFIIHIFSSIYVWIGKNCGPEMVRDAKAAACQAVRYESAQGPIITVEEGKESSQFWEALSNAPSTLNKNVKAHEDHGDLAIDIDPGKRKVKSYDADFELFLQAIRGGIVPPFSLSVGGHETHIPARESDWNISSRKSISSGVMKNSRTVMCRVYSDSALMKETDAV